MSGVLYTTEILRLATSIPHLGRLAAPDATIERRAPICGSRITVDLTLDSDERVTDFAQSLSACALGQASAALLGTNIIGTSFEDIQHATSALRAFLSGQRADPGDWPGLIMLAAARPHSARHASILLPFEATHDAMLQAIAAQRLIAVAR